MTFSLIAQSLSHTKHKRYIADHYCQRSVAVFCEGKCQLLVGEETHYVIKIEQNGQGKMKKTKPEAIAMAFLVRPVPNKRSIMNCG